MQKVTTYCDGCGQEKKETNNWFHVREDSEGFTISHEARSSKVYCGQRCLMEALSGYIHQNWKTESKCPDSEVKERASFESTRETTSRIYEGDRP